MSLLEWVIWCTALIIGIYCFKSSMDHLKKSKKVKGRFHGYLRWHTLWHLSLPLGAAIWMIARNSRMEFEGFGEEM